MTKQHTDTHQFNEVGICSRCGILAEYGVNKGYDICRERLKPVDAQEEDDLMNSPVTYYECSRCGKTIQSHLICACRNVPEERVLQRIRQAQQELLEELEVMSNTYYPYHDLDQKLKAFIKERSETKGEK